MIEGRLEEAREARVCALGTRQGTFAILYDTTNTFEEKESRMERERRREER
jgi:hypothetical protein